MGNRLCTGKDYEDDHSSFELPTVSDADQETQHPDNVSSASPLPERKEVPKDEHTFEEVDSDAIDIVLSNSPFLHHVYNGGNDPLRNMDQNNRKLVQEAGMQIKCEIPSVRRSLKLRIKLYDREGLTSDRVRYIEVISGTSENIVECYRQEDGTIGWDYSKNVRNGFELPDIPLEVYEFAEISSSGVSQVLNASQFLQHETDRRMVLEVASRIAKEPEWKMRHCELTIILHNLSGHVCDYVKHIVIRAGTGKYRIQCSNFTNAEIHWDCQERLDPGVEAPEETYEFTGERGLDINHVLRKSKFLEENKSHRTFVASVVRKAADDEYKFVRENCKLTITLASLEGATNTPVKYIIIKVGKCENEIRSSEHHPWEVVKRTAGGKVADVGSWLWRNTGGRLLNFGNRLLNCVEDKAVEGFKKAIHY